MAVTVRHLKRVAPGAGHSGAARQLLGVWFEPYTVGVNGVDGFQDGQYESRVFQEGGFTLRFPNKEGADSVRHTERFRIIATAPAIIYKPGHEFVEIYDEGDLMYVGTPVSSDVKRAPVTIAGWDPLWLLKKVREYYAGYWCHAPRDVFEHYTSAWKVYVSEDFDGASLGGGRFDLSATSVAAPVPPGHIRIFPAAGGASGHVRAGTARYGFPIGLQSAAPYDFWQVKVSYTRPRFGSETVAPYGGNANIKVGLYDTDAAEALVYIQLQEKYTYLHGPVDTPGATGTEVNLDAGLQTEPPGPYEIIVEGRERWVYFFVNQTLIGVLPMPVGPYNVVPFVRMTSGSPSGSLPDQYVDVDNFLLRRSRPFLMHGTPHGDYHVPGLLPPGGLHGHYFNDVDLKQHSQYNMLVFNPMRKPQGERLDPTLNFPRPGSGQTEDPATWPPEGSVGSAGKWFTVRWTGAIHLNLKDHDYNVRYDTAEEGARLWIGKTRMGEQLLDNWFNNLGIVQTSGSLRTHIGVSEVTGEYVDGWYPILVEYGQRGDAGALFRMDWRIDGGAWVVVPVSALSPFGFFNDQIKQDSHYEALRTLAESYGYQFVVQPKALEDSHFPGDLVPRARVGRDSDKVLTPSDVGDDQLSVNADDVADAILGDGTSLGDSEGNQLTVEALDYEGAEDGVFLLSEMEDFGDIGYAPLLQQRVNSLLALRSSGWEEVSAQPPGFRELTDTFPVTGAMALLDWKAGDGVRLAFPHLGVADASPRQILGVTRPFYPVALRAPQLSFRQRPRNLKEFLRRFQRKVATKHRHHQGQYVRTTGSIGSLDGLGAGIDQYSRVALPKDISRVVGAHVTVWRKPAVPLYVWVNDQPTTMPAITEPGTYDVSAYVARRYDSGNGIYLPEMRVDLRTTAT